MSAYACEAMHASGQGIRHEVEASTSEEAIAKIRGKGGVIRFYGNDRLSIGHDRRASQDDIDLTQ